MKRILLLAIVLLASCTPKESPLDKSIIEPLTIEELRVEMNKDSTFESTYGLLEKIKVQFLNTGVTKAKFGEITYRQFHEHGLKWRDTSFSNPLRRTWENEWWQKNADVTKKVDSVSNYWKEYCETYNIEPDSITLPDLFEEILQPIRQPGQPLNEFAAQRRRNGLYIINHPKAENIPGEVRLLWGNEKSVNKPYYIRRIADRILNIEIQSHDDYVKGKEQSYILEHEGIVGRLTVELHKR